MSRLSLLFVLIFTFLASSTARPFKSGVFGALLAKRSAPQTAASSSQHVANNNNSTLTNHGMAPSPLENANAADLRVVGSTKVSDKRGPEQNLTEHWWPLWWGRERPTTLSQRPITTTTANDDDTVSENATQKSESIPVATSAAEENDSNDEALRVQKATEQQQKKEPKKQKSRKVLKSKKTPEEKEAEQDKDLEVQEEDSPAASKNTTAASDSPPLSATNSTESDSKTKQQSSKEVALAQPHPVFVMGGPPMAGGLRPTTPQQQQQMRNAATSLAAAEILGSLMGNGIRLILIMWGTRYFASRQESIQPMQHFVFERLNDHFLRDSLALSTALDEPPVGVSQSRWLRIMARRGGKQQRVGFFQRPNLDATFVKTVIVIEFGNNSKGELDLIYLANIVSFILTQHEAQAFGSVSSEVVSQEGGAKTTVSKPVELEVVFKIDSPGGSVATFGLAAAQVERLRRVKGISTTACVDKYAASGGYMIASQVQKLVAAPFATVGSVGVIMETLNFHDLLRQYGVQPLVIKAGEAKNPLTTFGAVTKSDMEMEQERLEKVHIEFQKFTIRGRPQLRAKVKEVCNGSVYIGREALALNLVDAIMTSDEYLMGRIQSGDRVLKVHKSQQSRMSPHVRFPSAWDLLPHLKGRIEGWISHPDTAARLMQTGSLMGFILHVLRNHMGKPPAPPSV